MSKLFSEITIGQLKLDNRIVVPPMCQYSAVNGQATEWHLMHYGNLALSGAGLLIFEATGVVPEGRISFADLGLWDDKTAFALKKVVD
ncbi:oxidoreductase, partial [Bacteroidaceae bacterium HV4-6-C5C]